MQRFSLAFLGILTHEVYSRKVGKGSGTLNIRFVTMCFSDLLGLRSMCTLRFCTTLVFLSERFMLLPTQEALRYLQAKK